MSNSEEISKYCERNLAKSKYFSEYIKRNCNFLLLMINKNLLSSDEISFIKKRLISQRMIEKYVKEEITFLNKSPHRIIGLKGFFLQSKYYPEEYNRIYGDIDILVSPKDSYSTYKEISSNGYSLVKYKFLTEFFRNFFIARLQHLILKKRIYEITDILIELHVNLNVKCKVKFNTKSMINNSIKFETGGVSFYIFEPTDLILYLMFHTISHLCYVKQSANTMTINLQDIFDVAQIIDKEKINWDAFIYKARCYEIVPFVCLYLHVFCDVLPGKIPCEVFEKIFFLATKSDFKWKKTFNLVMKKQAYQIILGDFDDTPKILNAYNKATRYRKLGEWKKARRTWRKMEKSL